MADTLGWICGGGKIDCSPIQTGGKSFQPNTVTAHFNWAANQYYQKHKGDHAGYLSCYFGGLTELHPPQRNLLFLSNNTLGHSTTYPSGVGVTSTLVQPPKGTHKGALTYIGHNLTAAFAKGTKSPWTTFSLWTAGQTPGQKVQADLAFDFNGDGKYDRFEHFAATKEALVPAYQSYANTVNPTIKGSSYKNLDNGTVRLRVWSATKGQSDLMLSTKAYPSVVVIPYDP